LIVSDNVQLPRGTRTEKQGASVPAGPADGRGDRRGDARRRRQLRRLRLRAIIVVLWRAGLRISEALALNETDLDPGRGSLVVRHGKGDKRREVGMDRWAGMHLDPWLELRRDLPVGRCSASCAARHAGGHALRPESALNCTTPPR
jgi:integrase